MLYCKYMHGGTKAWNGFHAFILAGRENPEDKTMMIRIAGFYADIEPRYRKLYAMCQPYICTDAPRTDLCVRVTEAEIRAEGGGDASFSPAEQEQLAVYRKICTYALAHDAFLMHCAVIEYEGRGYAFSAPSGTGKTTHIRLWQQVFGADKVTVVNGDKPILRLIDGVFYAYGTPWCGKEGYQTNTRVPLAGLCFLTRGTENRIRPISAEEAIPRLFAQIMVTDSPDLARQMELADALLGKVPAYLLACNMEPEAALVALRGMQAGGVRKA